jgi:hypothetical protein
MTGHSKPLRVLSLDGGGMRGTYTATYLDKVATAFALRRGVAALDIGAAFDLIVDPLNGLSLTRFVRAKEFAQLPCARCRPSDERIATDNIEGGVKEVTRPRANLRFLAVVGCSAARPRREFFQQPPS